MLTVDYNPHLLERSVQEFWNTHRCFNMNERDPSQPKFFALSAFPYPSGILHMGHMRSYTINDAIARFERMRGKQVFNPIGWDAFGLPAENAAMKHGIDPADWTFQNIDRMRSQLKQLGLSYDWDREIATCNPSYYQWEQWLFLQLYEKGLVYRKTSWVNWDPVDQTILANEQVIQGRGWRSGALVEKKAIPQWFLKISDYADTLLDDLASLEWPEAVKAMQRQWIGRSEGVLVKFKLDEADTLAIFTTRVDTLMGVTYLAIAPEHRLAQRQQATSSEIRTFLEEALATSTAEAQVATQEKKGIFTGLYAQHPITHKKIPIWIANFVDVHYGTGAVMAVPAHDTRDFEFATRYQLEVKPVIAPENGLSIDYSQEAYIGHGYLINSGKWTGMQQSEAVASLTQYLSDHQLGRKKVQYRLRDWGISRQRYWGTPIPIVHCKNCGSVPASDLPVTLPKAQQYKQGTPPPPLSKIASFYQTHCPRCGQQARRDTDTFDTFIESSWYFMRFLCPDADTIVTDAVQAWMPVDHYVIGIEHAILHLLYARFFYKLFHTLKLLPNKGSQAQEPFTQLLTQGMVLKNGKKMSKSKGNVVDPTTLIQTYGADALRLFTLFAAPPGQSLEWSDKGLLGASRFLKRVWSFAHRHQHWLNLSEPLSFERLSTPEHQQLRAQIHRILASASDDYQQYQFNTVVASCMKLFNLLQDIDDERLVKDDAFKTIVREGFSILLRLLAPLAPHMTHVLWETLNATELLLDVSFPGVDGEALKVFDALTVVVQVNGKRRAETRVAVTTPKEKIERTVLALPEVTLQLEGRKVERILHIQRKDGTSLLINIVLKP